MAKQLNVALNVSANTSGAKSQIQELQTLLHTISTGASINVDAASMTKASQAAQELSVHLNNAYNATTGNFDLSKLDKSLKTSGQNLQTLSTNLLQAGSMGEQAFTKLARSIAVADRPLIAMNAKLKEFSTTLVNTARWQLSSSMLHGFIGAISSAYGYAQDLNESLNNIQIVTGRTSSQMADFAVQANKAAKALSATTTEYTDAALIYYQQGDSTAEVMEKANITVKMANVVGQSAETVSDQLTAIWNNFDDGTKSLEYYVDAITALGAATASSTDEIAQGLEKFASVAETVGLSYEYATAALATVTAETRQSADVVGTAFKTLFARLQDLKLGQTLDDGTTLGTYSQNLAKVGINIKTASGELKDMDVILQETAKKWQTLDRDQQVALAKGVAGIRQYNTFMSLMNNWDVMEENLNTIEMSSGVLEQQANMYAQSWEAASNRVKASAEAIYDALLDDKFFISVSNGFSGLLDSVNAFIDGIGGVGGVITMISSLLMSHFAGKIGPALSSVAHNFAIMFQSAQKQASGLANQMNEVVQETLEWDTARKQAGQAGFSDSTVVSLEGSMAINKAKSQLTVIEKELTSLEKQRYEMQLGMIQAQQDEAEAAARVVEEIKKKIEAAQGEWDQDATQQVGGKSRDEEERVLMRNVSDTRDAYLQNASGENLGAYNEATQQLQAHRVATEEASLALEHYSTILQDTYVAEMQATNGAIENSTAFADVSTVLSGYTEKLQVMSDGLVNGSTSFKDTKSSLVDLQSQLEMATGDSLPGLKEAFDKAMRASNSKQLTKAMDELMQKLKQAKIPAEDLEKILINLGQGKTVNKIKKGYKDLGKATDDLKEKQEAINRAVQQFNPKHTLSGIEALTKGAAGLSSLAMAAQSVRSIFEAWNNDDLSWGEKLTTTLISLGMVIPMVKNGLGSLMSVGTGLVGLMSTQLLAASSAYVAANYEEVKSMTAKQLAQKLLVTEDQAAVLIAQAKTLALKENIAAMTAEELVAKTGMTTEQAAIVIKAISAGKTKEEALAEAGLTAVKGKGLLAGLANIGIKITEAIARKANKAATDSETTSLWAETAAKIASQAAAWPMLVVTLLLVAAIGLLVAIIWGVVAAFQAFAANSPEGQLKAAEATAAELAEALDAAKQKAEDLKNAFNSYDEVVEKLSQCEKGTREWTEALQGVNNQVLDLMKKYPELSTMVNDDINSEHYGESAISYGDSGEMVIADWAKEKLLNEANENVVVAQAASISANQEVRRKKIAIKENDFTDSMNSAVGYSADVGIDSHNDQMIALIKNNAEELSKMTRDQQKEFLQAAMEDKKLTSYTDEYGTQFTDSADRWMDLLDKSSNEFSQLTEAINQNTAAIDAENRAIATSALSDNSTIQSSELSEDILNASGHLYAQLNKEAMATLEGWGTDNINKASTENDEDAKKVWSEYLEAAGINENDVKLTGVTGTDSNRAFEYEDAEGNTKTVSLSAMKQTKAAYDAMNKLDAAAETLAWKFESLANSANASDHALQNFLANQNFFQATGSEITDIKGDVATAGGVEAYLDQAIGDGNGDLSDATAQKYGFKDAADMIKVYEQELAKVEEQWSKVRETIPDTIQGIEDISLESAQALANDYKELAAGPDGDKAVAALTEKLQYFKETLSPEDYQAFMEQIGDVDWSNWNALDDVQAILDGLGVSLDLTGTEWEEFADKMRDAGGANPAEHFKEIRNHLDGLGDAIKGVNPGDLIDETQYQSLIALNEDLADSFIKTADGYKYIGTQQLDVKDLQLEEDLQEMNEASQIFHNAEDAYKNSSISKMANSSFDTTDYDAEIKKMKDERNAQINAQEKEYYEGAFNLYTDAEKKTIADKRAGLAEDVKQKEKQKADAELKNKQLAADLANMGKEILADESLMEVAKAMNYDEAKIQEMINSGNTEGLQKLAKNVDTYMQEGLAGAYDSTELQEKMAATATNVQELNQMMYDGLITDTEVYQKQLTALTIDGIVNAQNLQELQDAMNTGGDYSYDLVADALIRLGEQYENCGQEIDAFNQALDSGNAEAIAAAQEQLEASIMIGEAAEKYGFDADEMEIQAAQMAKTYGISQKAAAKLAIENQRMNKGVATLSENWKDWKKELSKSDKTTADYAKAAAALTSTIADLTGASEDLELSPEFLEAPETLELVEKAAKGDIDAINQLGIAVAAESVKMMQLSEDITTTLENGVTKTISVEDFNNKKAMVLNGIQELQNQVASGAVKVGDAINTMDSNWIGSLNDMALATNMSVEEMNALLSELGVETEVTTVTKTLPRKIPVYTTEMSNVKYDDHNNIIGYDMTTRQTGTQQMDETIEVAQIGAGDNAGKPPKITYIGNGSVAPSSTGGGSGGGSGPKKADKVKKSEVVERYKEVTDALDDNTDAMDKASRAADRLYGRDRLKKMREANQLLQTEIDLTKQKRKEAEKYLEEDKKALEDAAKEAGVSLSFDKMGNISNYTEEMSKLYKQLDDEITKANADGDADEDEQAKIDAIQAKIDALQEAMDTYEDTRELIEDLDAELEEKFYEWQDNNFEILNTELELKIEINDAELEKLDYYLSKMDGDFYSSAETAALMGDQMNVYLSSLQAQQQYLDDLQQKYEKGEISQAAYVEGLKSANSAILDSLSSLNELDKSMMNYYGDTLAAAGEEIARYTSLMEDCAGVLDHYLSLAELLGKSTDYKYMGKILKSQAQVAEQTFKTSQSTYNMYKKQEEDRKKDYEDALARGAGEKELELLKKQWMDARAAANEQYDKMLSDAEAWAEMQRGVVENELAGFGQELENIFTEGYGSFDALNSAMERKQSLQEEYLTTTNKIYETNKLMRTAQQQLDKTSNQMAKQRLKNFINETSALQNQNKLSQFELDIQQAKYDLLLAEIALKEAQNAKSTVRLQRDSEGNFGYVYTADQSVIAEAQQKYEDAQNALYNKGLEGANDYVQKYQQTMSEMYDTLAEIQQNYLDGAYESEEEYNKAIEDAKQYYYEKLTQYADLYQIALGTDIRIAADAWTTEFGVMTTRTGAWQVAVEGYIGNVKTALGSWKTVMDQIRDQTLPNLDQQLEDVVDESEELAKEVTEEVIPAVEAEIDAVIAVTTEYGKFRDALAAIALEYENIYNANQKAIEQLSTPLPKPTVEDDNEDSNDDSNNNDNNNGNNNNNNNGNNNKPTWDNGTYTKEEVKAAQEWIGMTKDEIDGLWGAKSAAAALKKDESYTSLQAVMEAMAQAKTTSDPKENISGWGESLVDNEYGDREGLMNFLDSSGGFTFSAGGKTWYMRLKGSKYQKKGVIRSFEKDTIAPNWLDITQETGKDGTITYSFWDVYESPNQKHGICINPPGSSELYSIFDTGGYTGEWGPYGKMAMLHEKEIVLNAHDTENFLASMDILHRILEMIDLQSMSNQLGGILSAPNFNHNNTSTIEQSVHIEASFPNVVNHSEIEEAFNNLINVSSQYANRK